MDPEKADLAKAVAAMSVITVFISCGLVWGTLQGKVEGLTYRESELRADVEKLKNESVRKEEFNQAIQDLKAANSVISEDIKKILEKVSHGAKYRRED